ncbi:MAG: dihydroorotate dehydrogenase electron transfer subunit [Candidatus Omnitrophica bacterium]|nr:dihydroorotate dehydrogenase electron transfer subunit [Candidatus Omnitrophota bacterium]MCM8798570.1 dihydroorotate dehydrogenase electron transfer subunit [Candidatus Omnitrophota bacterium]
MVQIKAEIISNSEVAPEHFKLILESPEIAQEANPGQFLHIRVHEGFNPLLRRPFSIYRVSSNQIEILYKIRGKGTEILSGRTPGEILDVIGPLGKGFPLPEQQNTQAPVTYLLVAGGVGVAPLLFLAERLREVKNLPAESGSRKFGKKSKIKIILLLGAKSKDYLLSEKEFKDLCDEVKVATEDGSLGFKGLITDLLRDLLNTEYSLLNTILYAAGPIFMLQEIKKIANIFKILAFGSLEENIACGLGGCWGCVVKTVQGYKRICKEGPVFNLEEVLWE